MRGVIVVGNRLYCRIIVLGPGKLRTWSDEPS